VTGFVAGCAAGAALEVKFGLWALTLPWRNDPWIISRGIIKKTISASEHEEWFRRVLEGKESRMYIAFVFLSCGVFAWSNRGSESSRKSAIAGGSQPVFTLIPGHSAEPRI
jgi:hypothetical protein